MAATPLVLAFSMAMFIARSVTTKPNPPIAVDHGGAGGLPLDLERRSRNDVADVDPFGVSRNLYYPVGVVARQIGLH